MPTIIQLQDNRDIKNEDYLLIEQDKSRKVNIDTLISYIKKMTAVKDLDNNTTLNGSDCFLISQDKDRKVTLNDLTEKINKALDITTFNSTSDLNNNNIFLLIGQSNATSSLTKKVSLENLSTKINSNINLNNFDSATSVNNTDLIMLGQDKTRKVTVNELTKNINKSLDITTFDNGSTLNNDNFLLIGQSSGTLNVTKKVSLDNLSNKINSNMNLTQFESTAILNNSDYLMLGRQDKIRRITMQTLYTSIRSVLNIDDLENRINGVITTVGEGKQLISTAINNKGGNADASDTFYTLSQKINGLNINGFLEKDNKFYEIIINDSNNVELYTFYPVITASVEGDDNVSISITNTFYKETHNIKLCNSKGVTITQTTKESIKGSITTKLKLNEDMYDDSYIIKVIVNNKTFNITINHPVGIRGVWVNKANMPYGDINFTAQAFSDGSFMIIGGEILSFTKSSYIYNPSSNSWTRGNYLPIKIKNCTSAINNNDEIFVIGGIDEEGKTNGTILHYLKATNTWTTKSKTIYISKSVCEISNNIIYIFFGEKADATMNKSIYMYNTLTNTLTNNIKYDIRINNACSALYNNKIYIFGGLNKSGNAQSSVYVYNINTNTMSSLSDMPYSISKAGSCIINGLVYITGGYYYTGHGYSTNKVSCYDIENNTWNDCTPLNEARSLHGCVASNGEVYAISGRNNDGSRTETVECFTRRK